MVAQEPLGYLGGLRALKVYFSYRKKRHKLLNLGTLTIVNIDNVYNGQGVEIQQLVSLFPAEKTNF